MTRWNKISEIKMTPQAHVVSMKTCIEEVKNAKSTEEMFGVMCKLSSTAEKLDKKGTEENLDELKDLFVDSAVAIFRNPIFLSKIAKSLEEHQKARREIPRPSTKEEKIKRRTQLDLVCVEEKTFIQRALIIPFFLLSVIVDKISENEIEDLRNYYFKELNAAREKIGDFSHIEICFFLADVTSNFNYGYQARWTVSLDQNFLFNCLLKVRSLSSAVFLILTIENSLEDKFFINENHEQINISEKIDSIQSYIYKIKQSIEGYRERYSSDEPERIEFDKFVFAFGKRNELNALEIVGIVCSNINTARSGTFTQAILYKILNSSKNKEELLNYAKENISAFKDETELSHRDWSNKIYIQSYKLLSLFENLNNAKNTAWKITAAIHELSLWLNELHKILNKYKIEDDWAKISRNLIQEDVLNEWKSTFFTPTESEVINPQAEKAKSSEVFSSITSAILGMINTNGGVILVGVVENPDAIIRATIKEGLLFKNSRVFIDTKKELELLSKDIDDVKHMVQDELKKATGNTVEKFNSLIKFEEIIIKNDTRSIGIFKISVNKSDLLVYSINNPENKSEVKWIGLVKRADAQTISVDPRGYLQ